MAVLEGEILSIAKDGSFKENGTNGFAILILNIFQDGINPGPIC